ncbi:MAG TPA: DUF6544 family protein [Draconibacterium sp.]|nr:DUF6544 family protein [Draconibacterium sp.]
MKRKFEKEVAAGFKSEKSALPEKLTTRDLQHLPDPVKKYLHIVGAVGREKVRNVKITFEGKIRSKTNDGWMNLTAEQYSFFDNPLRIFYLRADKMKIPVFGLHLYKNAKASMVVKLAGLIKIVNVNGAKMDMAETVTHFNDMCLLAPATLIDKNIKWNEINPYKVEAEYTNGGNTISATLYFNKRGELFNFISTDRYDLSNAKAPVKYPFSTPVSEYNNYGDFYLAGRAKTIYHKPQGDFCYGEFSIKSIEYNCKE